MIDVTPDTAQYWQDACDAWGSGEYTEAEMAAEFPGLTQAQACEWSIRGFTVGDWLNFEIILQQLKAYADSLRSQIRFYRDQLQNRYESLNASN